MTARAYAKKEPPLAPPPALSNPDSERAVLGKLLSDGRLWYEVSDRLDIEHFADKRHKAIFKALKTLADRGSPLLRQLVPSCMGDSEADDISLPAYLAALIAEAPEGSIDDFVDAVLDAARRRHAIQEAEWLSDQMRQAELGRSSEILADAQRRLQLVGSDAGDDGLEFGAVLESVVTRTTSIMTADAPAGIETGLTALDELIGPLFGGQLLVIAGDAGSGKTSLVLQLLIMMAQKGVPSKIFSHEMQAEELGVRAIASLAEIPSDKIAEGSLNDSEMERVVEMQRRFNKLPIYIDDRPNLTTGTILARAARDQVKHGVRIFVTDHLRMVRANDSRADERVRLEQIVQDHKSMAKRLNVPWILLAHSHRTDLSNVKTAKDIRRPNMRNLYGSSAVENTADAVIFVHRPSVILADVRPTEGAKHKEEYDADCLFWEGKAEFILGKHRSRKGRGIRTVKFFEERTWFE